ncbi:MAG: methyltransferase type 11, partial [Bacteroidota bacterium]
EILYAYGTPGKIAWKLSMKYPMQMLNASKLFFVILPFYYLIAYPFAYVLNWIDTYTTHKTGTGLIVKAWK